MRSHAKASTAGSTQRQAKGLGRFFRGAAATRGASPCTEGSGASKAGRIALALCMALLASLALSASPAAASQGHYLKEVFGSGTQPTLIEARDVAIDQSTGDLLVMEATEPTFGNPARILRFKPDGTPDNFSALGSNAIDGKEGPDATPQEGLDFANRVESQIAIDNSGGATNGNIYVTHGSPNAIDVFASSGAYLGQLTESSSGPFSEACGVAVDSAGAVYVGDYFGGIHKYVPSGAFPVNTDNTATFTTTSEPCTLAAGVGPTAGFLFPAQLNGEISKIDSSTGELKYTVAPGSHVTVAVDPGSGRVFAAGTKKIEEFDASGAASATSLSTTNLFEFIHGIDVRGSSGEIYLIGEQTSPGNFRAEVFDDPIATIPDLETTDVTANTGTHATLNATVNPDGVELDQCRFEYTQTSKFFSSFIEYDHTVPCVETPAAIGSGTSPVPVHADISNLTPQGTHYVFRIAAKNPATTLVRATNQNEFKTADTVFTEAASGITDTAATLNGTVNPDGVAMAECLFEWGLTTAYGNTAPCVPNPAGIGTGTSPVAVSAAIGGLQTATVYHYRLKAANADGPIAPAADMTLQSAGPRLLDSWAEDVLTTEATLKAEIDPEEAATTYRFEYGPTAAYGTSTGELNVAADSSVHEVFLGLNGLQPGTEYHFRVIATNAAGTNEGPDHVIRTFRTFSAETDCPNQANRYGAGANLPDCRAYEMVSPLDKNNGDIVSLFDSDGVPSDILSSRTQTTPSGDKLTYSSYRAFADAQSVPWSSQYIAQRVAGAGWQTHSINQPGGPPLFSGGLAARAQYEIFSKDLCHVWMRSFFAGSLSAATVPGYSNVYRRDDRLCGPEGFDALAPIAPPLAEGEEPQPKIEGVSADGSHMIFDTTAKLVPEGTTGLGAFSHQLYESAGPGMAPRLVCILPGGEAWGRSCTAGSGLRGPFEASLTGAISEDGERIFWTNRVGFVTEGKLYVRIGGTETVPVSQAGEEAAGTTDSWFWGAALDGSRAVYTTGGSGRSHLFAFDVDGEATEAIAAGVRGVLGMSEDARRVYFISEDVLAGSGQNSQGDEAIAGELNLYYYDADAAGGTSSFIATLANENLDVSPISRRSFIHLARVTPDGLHVAFASKASLTGYDNKSLANAESELYNRVAYVYDAQSDELICASCNPSGARGKRERAQAGLSYELFIPIRGFETAWQPSRVLSDDGSRLFFESANALDPRDSNGKVDVYEWEQEGHGGCNTADPRFAQSAGGCIWLLSPGTSDLDSLIAEATPDGSDVFLYTKSSLIPSDYGLRDIYDARVGGGFPLPPEAPECVGDACQSVPAAPNDPTPASAGFRGAGNPAPRKAQRRRCRARVRKGAKGSSKAKQKKAKRCRRNKGRAGR